MKRRQRGTLLESLAVGVAVLALVSIALQASMSSMIDSSRIERTSILATTYSDGLQSYVNALTGPPSFAPAIDVHAAADNVLTAQGYSILCGTTETSTT